MPVNLSDIRTFAADSVRVQRLQELQQLASRTNQAQLATQFEDALGRRRASVKETDEADNPNINPEQDSQTAGQPRGQNQRESTADGADLADLPAAIDGIGENIDLRG
jgi:hypothetical protein